MQVNEGKGEREKERERERKEERGGEAQLWESRRKLDCSSSSLAADAQFGGSVADTK